MIVSKKKENNLNKMFAYRIKFKVSCILISILSEVSTYKNLDSINATLFFI